MLHSIFFFVTLCGACRRSRACFRRRKSRLMTPTSDDYSSLILLIAKKSCRRRSPAASAGSPVSCHLRASSTGSHFAVGAQVPIDSTTASPSRQPPPPPPPPACSPSLPRCCRLGVRHSVLGARPGGRLSSATAPPPPRAAAVACRAQRRSPPQQPGGDCCCGCACCWLGWPSLVVRLRCAPPLLRHWGWACRPS